MALTRLLRPSNSCLRTLRQPIRCYSSPSTPPTSPFAPRHLLSIADLSPQEVTQLVRNAASHKAAIKSGSVPSSLKDSLLGKTIAMMFTKRSTRTRVSTEAAVARMGGHAMFLGSQDIQLGVNESLYDTSVVISSMVQGIVARVNAHSDVADLAKHSSVPVINALSDAYHPLQTIADYLTIHEAFNTTQTSPSTTKSLGLEGLKVAWVGDANNVLFDLAIGAAKLGVDISVATPAGYEIPADMRQIIHSAAPAGSNFKVQETQVPEEAVKNADIIVTDTWVSMGQEAEYQKRLKAFAGFQVTQDLATRGGAKEGWKFMHCLPRHPEEVADEVFYSPASLVFQEAENRLWAAISALESFVVNKGEIRDTTGGAASSASTGSFEDLQKRLSQLAPDLAKAQSTFEDIKKGIANRVSS
ncbi:ornithine carbamoyltransferase [Teratosphaeria destructans]|uniref:Ornithine carbamoyltransferase, mitochondrial n=1 Tax=Teratosphaeria destructans TaxID=418781 RepID=A0A9W7SJ34_9PEZI|nr:ornithine carbamoyltransferase [Teratosphaeria destructans]